MVLSMAFWAEQLDPLLLSRGNDRRWVLRPLPYPAESLWVVDDQLCGWLSTVLATSSGLGAQRLALLNAVAPCPVSPRHCLYVLSWNQWPKNG
jgi:hypothetical protein